MGAGVAITLAALGGVIYILKSQSEIVKTEKEVDSAELHLEALPKNHIFSFPYEINQVSMAIMNRKGTKTSYVQFSLILDCPNEEAKKTLTMNRAKLLDAIFVVGSGFYLDDFNGQEASKSFDRFKTQLLEKYQSDFHAQAPREIALKDWIVN